MDERARNVETFERFLTELFGAGRVELIDELLAPDYVEHEELPPEVPPGPEGLKLFVQAFRQGFPDMQVQPTVTLADGDLVAGHIEMSGTHQGEFMGVPATGNTVQWKWIDIVRFRDGKAVEHWGSSDIMALMRQIGAAPPEA